ncbi:hypothetical protein Vadar_027300 [Vaccinium darrowii]|uniref:Uncharacterized protein n=1 Tax=Vaccinium darrowii TaxID=229202 RepID=A0ACB7XV17_9ERIC|nr:hypothetical protein Vadar_027300 [Vaccinium darrowii]
MGEKEYRAARQNESQEKHIEEQVHAITQKAHTKPPSTQDTLEFVHVVTQAFKQKPTPPSKVARIKDKTTTGARKPNIDPIYTYPLAEKKDVGKAKMEVEATEQEEPKKLKAFTKDDMHTMNLVTPNTRKKLRQLWKHSTADEVVYTAKRGCFVLAKHIQDILLEKAMEYQIMDSYTELLVEEQDKLPTFDLIASQKMRSHVFSANLLNTFESCKTDAEKDNLVGSAITKAISSASYLYFPIIKAKHYTLLTLDTIKQQWLYYNPLKIKGRDTYFEASTPLRLYITQFMCNKVKKTRSNQFSSTAKMCHTPAQMPDSADSGPIICYIIQQHLDNKEITKVLARHLVREIRAIVVQKIMDHPSRSWRLD